MIISQSRGLTTQPWKELYHAAMCEPDLNKLPQRLSDAEAALVARAQELIYAGGDDGEEGESLDHATCIVHALRESLSRRNSARKNGRIPPQAVAATMTKCQTFTAACRVV
jgi:hypothetical protein